MSATIHYRNLSTIDPSINTTAPQSFMELFDEAYGRFPIRLYSQDITRIEGMRSAVRDKQNKEALTQLIDAIMQFGAIELYARY